MSALPSHRPVHAEALEASGRRVFDVEVKALEALKSRIGPDFARACIEPPASVHHHLYRIYGFSGCRDC